MYSRVIRGRVEVREQAIGRSVRSQFRFGHFGHAQHRPERRQLQPARGNLLTDRIARRAPVAGEERLDAARSMHPRAIDGAVRERDEPAKQALVEKRQVAGDDNHPIEAGDLEGRGHAAQGAQARLPIRVARQPEIRKAGRVGADDHDLGGHTLQDIHLTEDDGPAFDDEPTLVPPAKPTCPAARHNRRRRSGIGHRPIMTEVRVGRLVGACLHQAIVDRLPQRLEFYEHWLRSESLRDGSIGLAPITAVMGFLRTEGQAYDPVVVRAGELAAEWTIQSMPAFRRRLVHWLPKRLRTRAALRIAAGVVRLVSSTSRASSRLRRHQARLDVVSSLFCTVRETTAAPLCGFYVGVATRALAEFGIAAQGRVDKCRAAGGATCVITLDLGAAAPAATSPIAA